MNEESIKCPKCGYPISENNHRYYCTNNACDFFIVKFLCGKRITKSQIKILCAGGRTAVIKNMKSKSGSHFDAALCYNTIDGKVEFIFY